MATKCAAVITWDYNQYLDTVFSHDPFLVMWLSSMPASSIVSRPMSQLTNVPIFSAFDVALDIPHFSLKQSAPGLC